MASKDKIKAGRASYHPSSKGAVPGIRKKNPPARFAGSKRAYAGAEKAIKTFADFWKFCFRRWSGLS